MPAADFHNRPFDEGTLTKLQIFELYARSGCQSSFRPIIHRTVKSICSISSRVRERTRTVCWEVLYGCYGN